MKAQFYIVHEAYDTGIQADQYSKFYEAMEAVRCTDGVRVVAITEINTDLRTAETVTGEIAAAWWAKDRKTFKSIDEVPEFLTDHYEFVEAEMLPSAKIARQPNWSLKLDSTGVAFVGAGN